MIRPLIKLRMLRRCADSPLLVRSALALLAALSMAGCTQYGPDPFHGKDLSDVSWGRSLQLQDVHGNQRTLQEFRGRFVLLTFGYTHCPEICPLSLMKNAEVKRLLGDAGGHLELLFVTVDPERDTAEVIERYAAAFDPEIVALRGDDAQTRVAARNFSVTYRKVPTSSGYAMDHTLLIYLIGPGGRLQLAYEHDEASENIVEDIERLIRRQCNSPISRLADTEVCQA